MGKGWLLTVGLLCSGLVLSACQNTNIWNNGGKVGDNGPVIWNPGTAGEKEKPKIWDSGQNMNVRGNKIWIDNQGEPLVE